MGEYTALHSQYGNIVSQRSCVNHVDKPPVDGVGLGVGTGAGGVGLGVGVGTGTGAGGVGLGVGTGTGAGGVGAGVLVLLLHAGRLQVRQYVHAILLLLMISCHTAYKMSINTFKRNQWYMRTTREIVLPRYLFLGKNLKMQSYSTSSHQQSHQF